MRMLHGVRVGAWLLIVLQVLSAGACVAIFARMSPAVATILDRNDRSLSACQDMLAALAHIPGNTLAWGAAWQRAADNITEPGEHDCLVRLQALSAAALAGDTGERAEAIATVQQLADINRLAMQRADARAVHLGRAGAWGVVLCCGLGVLVALSAVRQLERRVMRPLQEIHLVVQARSHGDHFRRLGGAGLDEDIRRLFAGLNTWLDQADARSRGEETQGPP